MEGGADTRCRSRRGADRLGIAYRRRRQVGKPADLGCAADQLPLLRRHLHAYPGQLLAAHREPLPQVRDHLFLFGVRRFRRASLFHLGEARVLEEALVSDHDRGKQGGPGGQLRPHFIQFSRGALVRRRVQKSLQRRPDASAEMVERRTLPVPGGHRVVAKRGSQEVVRVGRSAYRVAGPGDRELCLQLGGDSAPIGEKLVVGHEGAPDRTGIAFRQDDVLQPERQGVGARYTSLDLQRRRDRERVTAWQNRDGASSGSGQGFGPERRKSTKARVLEQAQRCAGELARDQGFEVLDGSIEQRRSEPALVDRQGIIRGPAQLGENAFMEGHDLGPFEVALWVVAVGREPVVRSGDAESVEQTAHCGGAASVHADHQHRAGRRTRCSVPALRRVVQGRFPACKRRLGSVWPKQ